MLPGELLNVRQKNATVLLHNAYTPSIMLFILFYRPIYPPRRGTINMPSVISFDTPSLKPAKPI